MFSMKRQRGFTKHNFEEMILRRPAVEFSNRHIATQIILSHDANVAQTCPVQCFSLLLTVTLFSFLLFDFELPPSPLLSAGKPCL